MLIINSLLSQLLFLLKYKSFYQLDVESKMDRQNYDCPEPRIRTPFSFPSIRGGKKIDYHGYTY